MSDQSRIEEILSGSESTPPQSRIEQLLAELVASTGGVDEEAVLQIVNGVIDDLVDGAPTTFDTLKEISDWISSHQDVYQALVDARAYIKGTGTSSAKGLGAGAASGNYSHAEGYGTQATGLESHAEGHGSTAQGATTHAEGQESHANGNISHAEGYGSTSNGVASHAEGDHTIANRRAQHVVGKFNISDTTGSGNNDNGTYAEIVGNGTDNNHRSNARTVDWQGNEKLAGGLTLGMGTEDETSITASQLSDLKDLLGIADESF